MITRKIMLFLASLFVVWTITLMDKDSVAQSKKDQGVTTINTTSPYFEFVYGGESESKTAVRILVIDNQRQYVAMNYARMRDKSNEQDPLNYWVKLINDPDIHPLAFRQAESMEENAMTEDGLKVLVVRFKDLQAAALIWYQ